MPSTRSDLTSSVIFAVATAPERRVIERSNIGAHRSTLLQTGVGPAQVRSMAAAIATAKPAGLISIGTAGGLVADLSPGCLLLPQQVSTEDGEDFSVTTPWHTRVLQQLTSQGVVETGCMVSVSRPIHSPQEKQELQARSGAVSVDMESAELARLAAHHSIPFLVIRAVADPYDQQLPRSAVAALTSRGDLHIAGLLGQLLRRPGEITGLFRLQANFRAASRTLTACCHAAGQQLFSPDQ